MKKNHSAMTPSVLPYVGIALVLGLTVFAGPAMAQIPVDRIDTFRDDIWTFMIENVGLMVVGLAIGGALLGGMVSSPGRGVAGAVLGCVFGVVLAAVPAISEYAVLG